MSSEKRSISAPASLFKLADARKEKLNFSTFSDYIQELIRVDTMKAVNSSTTAADQTAKAATAAAYDAVSAGEATSRQTPSDEQAAKPRRRKGKK